MKKPKSIELEVRSGDKTVKIIGQNCTVKKKWFPFGKKNEFMACEDFQVSDDVEQEQGREEEPVEEPKREPRDDRRISRHEERDNRIEQRDEPEQPRRRRQNDFERMRDDQDKRY